MPESQRVLLRRLVLAWLTAGLAGAGIFVCVRPFSWLALVWLVVLLATVVFGLIWTRGCRTEQPVLEHVAASPAPVLDAAKLAEAEHEAIHFLSVAGHDLRQPMQAISMYAATLAALDMPEQSRQLIAGLETASETLSMQFEEVIAISKLAAGRVRFDSKPVMLGTVLESVVASHLDDAHDKSLHLRAVASRLRVQADEMQLVRVLDRVVAHAVRTTERGGVLMGCRRRGDDVLIEVRTSSGGLDARAEAEVFVPFSDYGLRLPDRGLGIALAEQLARALGANLTLRIVQGRGDIYTLRLPRLRGAGLV